KDLITGSDRELYRGDRVWGCIWAHRTPVLYCGQPVGGSKTEVVAVSVESSRAETVGAMNSLIAIDFMTTDDRKIIGYRGASNDGTEGEIGQDHEVAFLF